MAACFPTLLFIYLWLPLGSARGPAGRCFLTAFLQNGGSAGPDFRLLVSRAQEAAADSERRLARVIVEAPGAAFRRELTLEPGRTLAVKLPSSVELRGSGTGLGAVRVTSSLEVSVLAVNSRPRSLDTARVLPCEQLGRRYVVVTPALRPGDRYKEFAVVAGPQSTRVRMIAPCPVTLDNVTRQARQPLDVVLAPFGALQVQSERKLSGTVVSAEHPVALVAGHSCLRAGRDCELVCEQLLPVGRWGRAYAVPPFATRDPGTESSWDYAYVVADSEGHLDFWRGGAPGERLLEPGRVLRFQVDSRRPLALRSSVPLQVLFLAGGGSRWGVAYDPWFARVPAEDAYGPSYSLTEQPGFSNVALLVAPGEGPGPGSVLLDGRPLTHLTWRLIPCGDGSFSWAEVPFGTGGGGSHRLETLGGQDIGVLSCGTSANAGFGTQAVRQTVLQTTTLSEHLQAFGSVVDSPQLSEPDPLSGFFPLPRPQLKTLPQVDSLNLPLPNRLPHSLPPSPGPPPHPFLLPPVYSPTCKNYFCSKGTSCRLVKNVPRCVAQRLPETVAEAVAKPVTVTGPESLSGPMAAAGAVSKPEAISETAAAAGPVDGSVAGPVAETLGGAIRGPFVVGRSLGESESEHQPGLESGIGPIAGFVSESEIGSEPGLGNGEASIEELGLESVEVPGRGSDLGSIIVAEDFSEAEPGPEAAATGTCWASGLPYFHTFDRRSFAVPGACAYTVCRCPQGVAGAGLPAFHVWFGGSGGQLPFRYVALRVFDHTITAARYEYGFVRVNQQQIRLPATLANGKIRLYYRGTELWAEAQIEAVTGPGIRTAAKAVAGERTGSGSRIWTGTGTTAKEGAAVKPGAETRTETWTASGASPKVGSETWMGTDTGPKAGAGPWTGTSTGPKIKEVTGSKTGTEAQTGAEVPSSTWTTSEIATAAKARVGVGTSMGLGPQIAFRLIYDWQQALSLKVSGGYRGHVGGLCGNFNGDPADDLSLTQQGPSISGSSASVRLFAQAWALEPKNAPCHSQWGSPCIVGPEGPEVRACMLMENPKGPFGNCHPLLDPKPFVLSCLEAACAFPGYRPVICQELETYAHACQREGVSLGLWRPMTYCPRICGPNSHYEPCGSACPATCADQEPPRRCPLPCLETCACDPGFVRSGPACVRGGGPGCGCRLEGLLLAPGEALWTGPGCGRRCWCPAGGGRARCRVGGCGPGERCAVTGGVRGCRASGIGTCRAAGAGHFETFDGHRYRFSGSCSYLLSGLTSFGPSGGQTLTPFRVLLNAGPAGRPGGVEVFVPGGHVRLDQGQAGRVLVNGAQRNLPCQLGSRVLVFRRGWDTVMSCDFGLEVAFDGGSHLVLALPKSYAGQVAGLCANYDGDPANDLLPALGHPTASGLSGTLALVHSCRVGTAQGCREEADDNWKHAIGGCEGAIGGCHSLIAHDGPFRLCHQRLLPQGYFEDCVQDACLIPERGACPIIADYAAACQEEGILIYPWRTSDFCRPPCPAHSHYELCGPACPVTCGSLSGPAGCQARRCREGCVCDPGFVLSGAACVPLHQCGCLLSGHYYEPGLQLPGVWGEPCRSPCVCQAGGQVSCPCKAPQTSPGPAGSSPGLCLISGGSHCRTFDGSIFRLSGHCSYLLASTAPNSLASLPPFSVLVDNGPYGAAVNHVTLAAAGHHFGLDRGDWGYVTVDGVRRCLPFGLPGGEVRAFMQGASMVLVVQEGPRLVLSQGPQLSLTLPAAYRGYTLGLCGNYNGDSADDLMSLGPDPGFQSCPLPRPCPGPGCPSMGEAASAPFQGPDSCGLLLAAEGPFAPCHRALPPEPFFQSCLADVLRGQGSRGVLCSCLRSYVAACQEAGAQVLPWRSSELCSMHCPEHSHYSLCADPCPAACPGLQALVRTPGQCAEGCQCDPGYFPAAGTCVPLKNCPCFHQGLYFSPGQTVLTDQCTSACSCQPGKGVSCVPHRCPAGSPCSIRHGILGCAGPAHLLEPPGSLTPALLPGVGPACPPHSRYVPCGPACPATCVNPAAPAHCGQPCAPTCQCEPGRLLLAGRCVPGEQCGCLRRPGRAFWTEGCARRCRCPPAGRPGSAGPRCWPARCQGRCEEAPGGGHHCRLIRLGAGPQPVTCTASGDFRFHTFGGARYSFPGSCVYRLAGPCGVRVNGDPFYLDMATQIRPLGCSKSLTLRACGLQLDMSPGDPGLLRVDGVLESLPFLHGRCLRAYSCGGQLCLDTASGLSLTYDWDSLVRLSVPRALAGSLCGLCGAVAGGTPTSQLSGLAHSWKVAEVPGCGPSCGPYCPPSCPATRHGRYRGLGYCGLLGASAGPLGPCHRTLDPAPFMEDCMEEVCQHRGCRRALCRALGAYVAACQARGVPLRPWRTPGLCPLRCPAHSHYELCGPPCPVTCGAPMGPKGCKTGSRCREGCVCDAGFVLSGATCVPRGRCGCLHAGRYHALGTSWYPGPGCERRCRCGPGGTVSCGPGRCRPHEVLRPPGGGVRGCFPESRASCFLAGPTHGLTFDGHILGGLARHCVYVLARASGPGPEPFGLQVEEDEAGPQQIHLRLYGHRLLLDRRAPGFIRVDGERCRLPLVLPGGRLWATREGRVVVIQAACGLRLLYDSARHLRLTVPSTYRGRLSGLCGNFNGDGGLDDFGPVGSLEAFVTSWALPGPGPCSPAGPCPPCPQGLDAAFSGPSACGLLRLPWGPFGSCHGLVRPDPFFGFCLQDMCQGCGGRLGLCDSLTAYMEACQEAGADVRPWRSPSLCPLRCPPRSHYSICARTCDLGCVPLLAPARCSAQCFEGCECDPGFVYDGAGCVSQERCGCFHRGRYISVSETLLLPGCRERCVCQVGGRLRCQPFQCPQGLNCVLDRGVRSCREPLGKGSATCRLVPGGLFTTFDGFQGRVPSLASPGAYELAVLARAEPRNPAWFRVVTEYLPCSACPAPQTWVTVRFQDGCVAVGPNREVWVNGQRAQLPVKVCKGARARWAGPGKVLVERPPLLQVLVGPKGAVVLRAARALGGQLQAACGDFNGDPRDDLRLKGGLPATSLDAVFRSCQAQAFSQCTKKLPPPVQREDYFSP
ncbi:IgGFc-binding protein-like [Sminthopsis crassicaudata]|uniref:IgGFc-binding protein-like n=1 Tax=Sminthopsis crassicaudata TaxID=9301 RepID=UPI003D6945EC